MLSARRDERLPARRRRRRRRVLIACSIFVLLLLCALVWGLRQPAVRISRVQVFDSVPMSPDTQESLATIATTAMQGNYLGIIPRDSIFFFPETIIRTNILIAHPELATISLSRNWMTGVSITAQNRIPIARWCGDTTRFNLEDSDLRLNLVAPTPDCYLFDAHGFIFATTSPLQPINSFIMFGDLANTDNPIGTTLQNVEKLPTAFNFARQLSSFGATVSSVVFRGDEVDDYVASSTPSTKSDLVLGTRITYVLGDEQNAFTALSSAQSNFNLTDGSIEYIDLRFDGKMYIKRK